MPEEYDRWHVWAMRVKEKGLEAGDILAYHKCKDNLGREDRKILRRALAQDRTKTNKRRREIIVEKALMEDRDPVRAIEEEDDNVNCGGMSEHACATHRTIATLETTRMQNTLGKRVLDKIKGDSLMEKALDVYSGAMERFGNSPDEKERGVAIKAANAVQHAAATFGAIEVKRVSATSDQSMAMEEIRSLDTGQLASAVQARLKALSDLGVMNAAQLLGCENDGED